MAKSNYDLPYAPRAALVALGKAIALARQEKRWQQSELADRLSVTRQTIAKMEQGDPGVKAGVYFAAAWLLNVPLIYGIDFGRYKSGRFCKQTH